MKNIREIAKLSGVSTATVSRYINNSGKVSKQTADKIQKVLDKHEYFPNSLASALYKGSTTDIGLIVQNIVNPFFSEYIDYVEEYAREMNYSILICNAKNSQELEKQYYNYLVSRRVAGIIVMNTNNDSLYDNSPIPIVAIEKKIPNKQLISANNTQGINELMKSIKDRESKKFLFIKAKNDNYSSSIREKTFVQFAKSNMLEYGMMEASDNFELLNQEDIEYIQQYDVVMCWCDIIAHKVYSSLVKDGLSIPGDIEITGYDGIVFNRYYPYDLTTVNQQIRNVSIESIKNLISTINTKKVLPDVIVDVSLNKGKTIKD